MQGILILAMMAGIGAPEKLQVADGHVIVWRTHELQQGVHRGIERGYIMVHGTNRNAEDYFRWALASTIAADRLDRTAVVAPHFKARTQAGRGDAVELGEWFWTNEGWKAGLAALNGAVTSYDVMDRILECFNDAARWPDLREVVVAGHSAGGQYVQRYAAFNRQEPRMRVRVRYVPANPSSYVYPDGLRLSQGGVCSPQGSCTGEFIPYWDAKNCTTYNRYRYGLEELEGYAAGMSPEQVRKQFAARDVTYLAGELDTRTDDPTLDKSCPAQAQGANRRERGTTFWNYMKQRYQAQHGFALAPGCGHAAVCVFAGPAGVRAVFRD
ncbi:MAG: alpha/beta fold hydrolase [Acidobacteriota bacterium]